MNSKCLGNAVRVVRRMLHQVLVMIVPAQQVTSSSPTPSPVLLLVSLSLFFYDHILLSLCINIIQIPLHNLLCPLLTLLCYKHCCPVLLCQYCHHRFKKSQPLITVAL